MPYKRATLLFRRKVVRWDGSIIEMKVWRVPMTASTPEGFKYSLVLVDSMGRRVLGYDNGEGKGHHRHLGGEETRIQFTSMSSLAARFLGEVARLDREVL